MLTVCGLSALGAAGLWPLTGPTLIGRAFATTDRAAQAAQRVGPELNALLAPLGLALGAAVFIRILKEEKLLELFVDSGERFVLLKAFGICTWSGTLGPKLRQGDGQAPEGYYRVTRGQLNPHSAFHLSFDLGYPNAYDRAHGRTGSALMVHGSCVSIGCYAMTDEGIEQIYTLVDAALRGGQRAIQVHALPFRLDGENALRRIDASPWRELWLALRAGYLAFERDGRPPTVRVRARHYAVDGPG